MCFPFLFLDILAGSCGSGGEKSTLMDVMYMNLDKMIKLYL